MAKLVSKTYGDALFDFAVQENSIDALYEEAKTVSEVFESSEELCRLLAHPKIDKKEKEAVIEKIFEKIVSKDMTGLLVLMVSKTRQEDIQETLDYFKSRVKEHKNIGIAYVTTAIELREEQKSQIIGKLLDTTKYVEFEMNYSVDEALIGGVIIKIGDRIVDSSIKTKLGELAKDLRKIQLA